MQKIQARLRLKKGKERPLLQHHHWIYSGAVASLENESSGSLADVFTASGEKLGVAMLTPGRSIVGHMLARGEESVEDAIGSRIEAAHAMRQVLFNPQQTNAFRLINAEGDGIPGLIVDVYNGVFVLQLSHPALEELKSLLVETLQKLAPRAIYEKSTSFMRKKEGMQEARALLWGEPEEVVEVVENGLSYRVALLEGQKTGLFLDQREMRAQVRELSRGKKVLNCFAYTGGFSIAALAGGASHVDSVESSKKCEPALAENLALNALEAERHRFYCEDAIAFVAREPLDSYGVVVLDPPAFVKKREDIDVAFRAYKELNRVAIEKMARGSLLVTCSCSYHVSEELFQNIVFRASLEAKRGVKIVGRHRQAYDHPVSVFHPEGSYLKSLVLWVE